MEVHTTLDDVKAMLDNVARHTRSTPDEWVTIMGRTEENMKECLKPIVVTNDVAKLKLDWIAEFASAVENDVFSTDSIGKLRKTFRKARDCFTGSWTAWVEAVEEAEQQINKFLSCQRDYSSTVSNLKLVTATTYDSATLTRANCDSELAKVSADYKAIMMSGHRSAVKAEDRKYENCVEDASWKEKGWLGSGTSCASGVQGIFESSICNRKMTGASCLTGQSDVCQLGNNGLMMRSNKIYSHSATLKNDTCCNLHCYDSDALWYMFNNQPLCSSCLLPFAQIYWQKNCLPKSGAGAGNIKSYSEIIIAKGETLFKTKDGQFTCSNRIPFSHCCGGEGPTSLKSFAFKDHHCACAPAEAGLVSDFKSKVNVYLKRVSKYTIYCIGF